MKLKLKALGATTRGIYNTRAGPNTLPERFRYLHPEAASAFEAMEAATGGLIYSDILRSAEGSFQAMQAKTGVQPPGFSAHNFGFAVDVAVEETLKLYEWDYGRLLVEMEAHGWHCHRRDGARGYRQFEYWHFNHLGDRAQDYFKQTRLDGTSWAGAAELRIQSVYGPDFELTDLQVQEALKKLHMYSGDLDGIIGPHSRQAIAAFQRAWHIRATVIGAAGPRTRRVLAFVAAEREIV